MEFINETAFSHLNRNFLRRTLEGIDRNLRDLFVWNFQTVSKLSFIKLVFNILISPNKIYLHSI